MLDEKKRKSIVVSLTRVVPRPKKCRCAITPATTMQQLPSRSGSCWPSASTRFQRHTGKNKPNTLPRLR
ncbi:hypothetical protein ZHAS_00004730 [Anopheles sinensis]|uniref:Uncharacterized protein n=1 Tax=Anopheles sinensis TaxID=74873 RepID=A0A084VHN4_ANOSI|nr:hypothetical protein ZHAS_00004730 [Anopheles sinensis]